MEDGQGVKDDVFGVQIHMAGNLFDIGDQIGMAERDAFWNTFRARGKQHNRRSIGIRFDASQERGRRIKQATGLIQAR